MSKPFRFKKFTVHQDRCAMKVGTDGVLLGAWVSLAFNPNSILDIGAGTGIIALQMAQRSNATTIDAVELDNDAFEQCTENFEVSPWNDRLFCYHASIQEFASEMDCRYDLIVSNPPFHSEATKTRNVSRDRARFTESLPFLHLVVCAHTLLTDCGRFGVIMPTAAAQEFESLAHEKHLHLIRVCEVRGTPQSTSKRVLMEFSKTPSTTPIKETLIIETARHAYTPEYRELVQDFYLKL
ncbi:MAG TPA: methyltransferase [Flavobacteriaceae bacterium]|nr:methyltransferase [Flavobacteriaceae bacterium]HPF11571.1 methyltransferase [Flavobacteriaceae bacterium]HQU21104.1 methyltransferase [Flavobacteriaceae bacterium]HQU65256.1 methyltransferase [Flavobacteriaceae bacterium]HRW43571.1 methyltransferase [Flavobacteriaceae bacterium]